MPRLNPPRSRRGLLVASLGVFVAGCGVAAMSAAPIAQVPGQIPTESKTQKPPSGGEVAVPSTGQAVDTKKAVDVVRDEIRGGEADAQSPTPPEFLWQEADESLIRDEPYPLAEPVGLAPLAALVPPHNPMTRGRVELGKQLYYDQRISLDATVSCASCHDPAKGWTDNRVTSVGIRDQLGARNSPTVLNTAYGKSMFWDGRSPSLEGQAQGPIQNKIEMGDQSYRQIIERLRAIPAYRDQFRRVFGTDVTLDGLAKAIAAFERTAITADSRYDQYTKGDVQDQKDQELTDRTFNKLTDSEKRGMLIFGLRGLQGDDPARDRIDADKLVGRGKCTNCHAGDNFTDEQFHNLGVGFDAKKERFADLGRWVISPIGSKSNAERGAFKTPTLRDIDRTGPYMHDGSEATLEAVVEFYDRGGNKNPALDPKMEPLHLTPAEKADLIAFLHALTGRSAPVVVPTLPPGPDGVTPDPRAALNHPGAQPVAVGSSGAIHRAVGLR